MTADFACLGGAGGVPHVHLFYILFYPKEKE